MTSSHCGGAMESFTRSEMPAGYNNERLLRTHHLLPNSHIKSASPRHTLSQHSKSPRESYHLPIHCDNKMANSDLTWRGHQIEQCALWPSKNVDTNFAIQQVFMIANILMAILIFIWMCRMAWYRGETHTKELNYPWYI
jgi:hypothetical protein